MGPSNGEGWLPPSSTRSLEEGNFQTAFPMALAFAASAFGRSLAVAFFIALVEGEREEIPFNASTPDLSGEASHCDGSSHSE